MHTHTTAPLCKNFPSAWNILSLVSLFLRPTLYVRALRSIPYLPGQEELLPPAIPRASFTAWSEFCNTSLGLSASL